MTLNNVLTESDATSTSPGTVELKVGEVYESIVTYQIATTGPVGISNCFAGLTGSFRMAENGCGRTLQLRYLDKFTNQYTEWLDASTAVDTYLVDSPDGPGLAITQQFKLNIQIIEKATDDGGSGSGVDSIISASQSHSYSWRSISRESQDAAPGPDGQPVQVTPPGFSSKLSFGSAPGSAGYNTGSLALSGPISPSLANPSNLRLSNPVGGLSVVMDGQLIQQVENPVRATDVQTIPGGGFQVRFFQGGTYGAALDADDVPYSTVSYTPLQAGGDHLGGIRVTSSGVDQITRIRDTVSTSGTGESWRISETVGGIVRETQDFTTWFTYVSGKWERTDMVETTKDGALYSKTVRRYVYQTRREGTPSLVVDSQLFQLEESIYDTATTFTTTVWEPDPNHLGRVKSVLRPDGSWEAYEYYSGSESIANGDPVEAYASWSGLLRQTLRPWNGAPASPALATRANSESTLVVYDAPSTTTGTGYGHQETRRTTYAPGGVTIMKDWAETVGTADISVLISVLQGAGVSSAWLPGAASIRTNHSTEYASGNSGISTTSFTYDRSHVPGSPWVGSSFGSLDSEGNGSITGYERGTMNAGVFTPNNPAGPQVNWGSDIRSTTVTVSDFGSAIPFEATREVTIRDHRGKPFLTTLSILDGTDVWSSATTTTYEYPPASVGADGIPKEVIVKQDGRTISRRIENVVGDGTATFQWDEQGIETVTVRDSLGRTLSETRVGVVAGTGHDGQPDIVTTYSYDGHTTTVSVSSCGLTRSETTMEDLAGRTVSRTDQSGAVTLMSYPNGGRDTLTTLPGGLTSRVNRNIDGRTSSVTGTGVIDESYEYDISTATASLGNLITTKRIGDLVNSTRFSVTEQDWLGRNVRTTLPSPTGTAGETVSTISSYATDTNRLTKTVSASGTILYIKPYPTSNLVFSGQDANGDMDLNPSGTDRVSESTQNFSFEDGYWWQVSTSRTYDDGSGESAITNTTKRCLHGNPNGFADKTASISPSGLVTTTNTAIDGDNKIVTRTEQTNASATDAVAITVNGLLVSQSGHDTTTPTRWGHNPFGQPIKETSPRGAISRSSYYPDGSLATTTDQAGMVTKYEYHGSTSPSAGKIATVTNPANKTITYAYSNLGQITEEAGTATYKITYEYDEYGAKKKMFTWRDDSTPDCTEWVYQPGTGLLERKIDAAGHATVYSYYSSGKMATRTWARTPAVTTTYSYNDFGDLDGIAYSDSTPDVTFSDESHPHDRLGRPTIVIQDGVGSETLTYHPGREAQATCLYSSSHALLPGISISHTAPDAAGRPTGFSSHSPTSGTLNSAVYAYDTAGRLETVSDGPYPDRNYVYTYHPDSSLVSTVTSNVDDSSWFKESRYYDVRARLIGIRSSRTSGNSLVSRISSHAYDYDLLGRRVKNTFQDGSRWEYGYNDRSEVTSADRKTSAGVSVPQLGASYGYDGIGNRLNSTSPVMGDHAYTPNSLNQYGAITTGNNRTAIGRADTSWNVLVNETAADRNGDLYFRPLTADNANGPVWQEVVTRRDTGTPSTTGHFWHAAASVIPIYDFDGNLTDDGRWTYSWDAEHRLIQMESTTAATGAGHPYTKLRYAYDWQGRMLARTLFKGTAANPVFVENTRWLYDGWNPVIEFKAPDEASASLIRHNHYTWGLDLSNTLQGAGGVGGLLGLSQLTIDPVTYLANTDLHAPSYDGNGNVVAWTKNTDTIPTCRREYDAFGNTVVSEGNAPCGFGFSTKMQDVETGLYYYGFRHYDPVAGRWPSRDPIGEQGGVNLYGFVGNHGVASIDVNGLWDSTIHKDATSKWGVDLGVQKRVADSVGIADNQVDIDYSPETINESNWSWHFNRSNGGTDSRESHFLENLEKAKESCNFTGKGADDPVSAAKYLGTGLHPKQDIIAHGDYNRKAEVSDLSVPASRWGRDSRLLPYWHNWIANEFASQLKPDDPELDADTRDGTPTFEGRDYDRHVDGNQIIGHKYHRGGVRKKVTEIQTKRAYKSLQDFIKTNGGKDAPNCKCRQAFGVAFE